MVIGTDAHRSGVSPARKARYLRGSAAVVTSVAVLAGVSACGGSASSNPAGSAASGASSSAGAPLSNSGSNLQQQYESVIQAVLPSVVEITTSSGLGSGIVFDNAGDIVTNDHVVGHAKTFQVRLANSAHPLPASLVGTFPQGDLAVIKVSGAKNLHPASFADSSKVRLGQIVLAMGNPLGLASSVTNGIVSAVGRTLTEPQSADSPGATLPNSIQTSASINPGNSGGALVDLQGRVIGIPTLAATSQQIGGAAPGIGFAIPSNTVTSIASQLVKSGKVTNSHRAALGVEVTSLAGVTGSGTGAGVVKVNPGGAAAKAGIQAGDIITKINGQQVQGAQQLAAILANLKVGQTVSVTINRNGQTKTVKVTLGQLG